MTVIRPFDPALFGDATIDPDTANLNAQMIELLTGEPEWWIVGSQAGPGSASVGSGSLPGPSVLGTTITEKDGKQSPCA